MYVCRQEGPNYVRTFERYPQARGARSEFFMGLNKQLAATSAAGRSSAGSSSSTGVSVEGRDGVFYEQAVPEGRHKYLEKERLRQEMY